MPKKKKSGWATSQWRKEVLARDRYTCQNCGLKSIVPGFMDVDHVKSIKDKPELQYEVTNGRTLCPNCHRLISLAQGDFLSKCRK